jgi:hypothetical protein
VLHQDETLESVVIVTELDVAPLNRHEFSGSQPGAHCHQQSGMAVGANFQRSLQEPGSGRERADWEARGVDEGVRRTPVNLARDGKP